MQVNKHSIYDSAYTGSYNTKIGANLPKVVASEAKPMQFSSSTRQSTANHITPCNSKERDDAFDFAGIAG